MSLDAEDISKIAQLARLGLDDADVGAYSRDLSAILAFVETMKRVDTSGIEPLAHPLEMSQRLRADNVTEIDQRAHFQANAPAASEGLYLVPKVIE